MRRRSQRANAAKPQDVLPPDFDFAFEPDTAPIDWTEGQDGVPQVPPDVLEEVNKQFPELEAKAQAHDTHTGQFVAGGGGAVDSAAAAYHTMGVSERADHLAQHYADWQENLSVKEETAIYKYTGTSFAQMNRALRTDTVAGSQYEKDIKAAAAGLLQGKTPHAITVTRGVSGNSQTMKDLWEIASKKENWGKTSFADKGFCSTEITGTHSYGGIFRLTIHLPKGAPGGYVDGITMHTGEQEFLLPPGCHFTVKSAHIDSKGKYQMELEFLKCTWAEGKFMSMGRNEEKAHQEEAPATDDQTQVMPPKFYADVRGIVFDDPELQAQWAKALSEAKEE